MGLPEGRLPLVQFVAAAYVGYVMELTLIEEGYKLSLIFFEYGP